MEYPTRNNYVQQLLNMNREDISTSAVSSARKS